MIANSGSLGDGIPSGRQFTTRLHGVGRILANRCQRILVVEHDTASRRLKVQVLTGAGYEVEMAEKEAVGWDAIRAHAFNLLISDHNMPDYSGLELVKRVRSARLPLPVILTSSALPEEELDGNPLLQITATLLKPFSPGELLETVKEVLRAPRRVAFGRQFRPVTADSLRLTPHSPTGVSTNEVPLLVLKRTIPKSRI